MIESSRDETPFESLKRQVDRILEEHISILKFEMLEFTTLLESDNAETPTISFFDNAYKFQQAATLLKKHYDHIFSALSTIFSQIQNDQGVLDREEILEYIQLKIQDLFSYLYNEIIVAVNIRIDSDLLTDIFKVITTDIDAEITTLKQITQNANKNKLDLEVGFEEPRKITYYSQSVSESERKAIESKLRELEELKLGIRIIINMNIEGHIGNPILSMETRQKILELISGIKEFDVEAMYMGVHDWDRRKRILIVSSLVACLISALNGLDQNMLNDIVLLIPCLLVGFIGVYSFGIQPKLIEITNKRKYQTLLDSGLNKLSYPAENTKKKKLVEIGEDGELPEDFDSENYSPDDDQSIAGLNISEG